MAFELNRKWRRTLATLKPIKIRVEFPQSPYFGQSDRVLMEGLVPIALANKNRNYYRGKSPDHGSSILSDETTELLFKAGIIIGSHRSTVQLTGLMPPRQPCHHSLLPRLGFVCQDLSILCSCDDSLSDKSWPNLKMPRLGHPALQQRITWHRCASRLRFLDIQV